MALKSASRRKVDAEKTTGETEFSDDKLSDSVTESKLLRIGEAANLANVSERTIRYYEEIGLIKPNSYTDGGCRRYTPDSVEQIIHIRELQELTSLNLDDIKSILDQEELINSLKKAWKTTDSDNSRKIILREASNSLAKLNLLLATKIDRLSAYKQEIAERQNLVEQMLSEL